MRSRAIGEKMEGEIEVPQAISPAPRIALKLNSLLVAATLSLVASHADADERIALATTKLEGTKLQASTLHDSSLNPEPSVRGWGYLYNLLIAQGVPPERAESILSDPRMPEREAVYFRVQPRESKVLYRKHNTKTTRTLAREFYLRHEKWFHIAEARFGVPGEVIASLLQVETSGGRHTGNERVFYRLARLATVAEPQNIESNIEEQARKGDISDPHLVSERAKILEGMFLPQVLATIALADALKIHPLELRGSSGGAIGIPQFLPGNVSRYGVDADGDGEVDVFEPSDAILSTARFLSSSGWPKNTQSRVVSLKAQGSSSPRSTLSQQRQAILQYNRSDAYADTILAMSSQLHREISKTGIDGDSSQIISSPKSSSVSFSVRKASAPAVHARNPKHQRPSTTHSTQGLSPKKSAKSSIHKQHK